MNAQTVTLLPIDLMTTLTVLVLVGVAGLSGCESRDEARQRESRNQLKQVQSALANYHEIRQEPPRGQPKPDQSAEESLRSTEPE